MTNQSSTSGLVPVGAILAFYGDEQSIPKGWFLCNGRKLTQDEIDNYVNLANLLASKSYMLPNLGGLTLIGSGTQGGDGSTYSFGQTGGSTAVTLTVDQIPAHDHDIIYENWNSSTGGGSGNAARLKGTGSDKLTEQTGGGMAHENMQPYYVVNYIICAG